MATKVVVLWQVSPAAIGNQSFLEVLSLPNSIIIPCLLLDLGRRATAVPRGIRTESLLWGDDSWCLRSLWGWSKVDVSLRSALAALNFSS